MISAGSPVQIIVIGSAVARPPSFWKADARPRHTDTASPVKKHNAYGLHDFAIKQSTIEQFRVCCE